MNIFAMISKLLKVKFMSEIIKPINALSISIDKLWFKIVKGIDTNHKQIYDYIKK